MKKLILFLFAVLFIAPLSGQSFSELKPMVFQRKMAQVQSQKSEYNKQELLSTIGRDYMLSADQIRQFALLLRDDAARLDFAKTAYENCADPENYYDVYDAFAYFSTAFRLHDYILAFYNPSGGNGVNGELSFPDLDFPSWKNYSGPRNCNRPMADMEFLMLARELYAKPHEADRLHLLMAHRTDACYPVTYLMKLATLLPNEETRYSYLTTSFDFIYDLQHIDRLDQLFANPTLKIKMQQWVMDHMPSVRPPQPPPCSISDTDMEVILADLNLRNFNDARMDLARQILSAKKCFTSEQVLRIVSAIEFESSRLELAKFAYDFCIDKRNYARVNNAFDFETTGTELGEYIRGKH